jgi:hypothetical protein
MSALQQLLMLAYWQVPPLQLSVVHGLPSLQSPSVWQQPDKLV